MRVQTNEIQSMRSSPQWSPAQNENDDELLRLPTSSHNLSPQFRLACLPKSLVPTSPRSAKNGIPGGRQARRPTRWAGRKIDRRAAGKQPDGLNWDNAVELQHQPSLIWVGKAKRYTRVSA
jgi:hypothetical protein